MINELILLKRELKSLDYDYETIKNYERALEDFIDYCGEVNRNPDELKIKQFLKSKHDSGLDEDDVQNQLKAIKFFYSKLYHYHVKVTFKSYKYQKKPPVILSKEEVESIIELTKNKKHRLLLALSYSSGLRVSEVVDVKIRDLDINKLLLRIPKGKGKKARVTVVSDKLVDELVVLIGDRDSDTPLFVSNKGGSLSIRTVQDVFAKAARRAGIEKDVAFHSLRHSFAAHLVENGVSINVLKEILGHKNIRNTEVYKKVATPKSLNVTSPL